MKNIATFLSKQPIGFKLYSPIFGACELMSAKETIMVKYKGGAYSFDRYGRFYSTGECLLFPSKEERNWSNEYK